MDSNLPTLLHTGISTLYRDNSLTDVSIRVGKQTFRCHKLVLSALSPYFRTMFTADFHDKDQDEIQLESVDADIFENILEFIYFSKTEVINEENVHGILTTSGLFLMEHLQELCSKFIAERLNSENVVDIWKSATTYSYEHLAKSSKAFCLRHFEDVMQTDEFLKMEEEDILDLIQDQNLNVTGEETVCNAVLRWYSSNKRARERCLQNIFQHLKLPLMEPNYIFSISEKFPVLYTDHGLRLLMEEAKRFHCSSSEQSESISSRVVHRNTSKISDAMLFIGKSGATFAYGMQNVKWIILKKLPNTIDRIFAACVFRNDVYLSGITTRQTSNAIFRFSINDNIWEATAGFSSNRYNYAMVTVSDKLLMVGGLEDDMISSDVTRFNLKTKTQETFGSLSTPVESMDAVVIKNKMFVFGGKTSDGNESLLIQCFDVSTKQCYELETKLPTPTSFCGAVSVDEKIYLYVKDQLLEISKQNMNEFKSHPVGTNNDQTMVPSLCPFDGKMYVYLSGSKSVPIQIVDTRSKQVTQMATIPECHKSDFVRMMKCCIPKSYFQ